MWDACFERCRQFTWWDTAQNPAASYDPETFKDPVIIILIDIFKCLNSKNYYKENCFGGEIMTRKRK